MKLVIENLGKRYNRDFWGIKNLDLSISTGVLGLLGTNGAGKSTLMKMIATVTTPTEGNIFFDRINIIKSPEEIRTRLGYLPQNFGVYPNLSAIEFLEYIAALKGITGKNAKVRINQLLELLNLSEVATKNIGSYSGGMKQRVGIAQALVNDPEILIVDEPTVGLDPEERISFREILTDLSTTRIVIFSTHIVSDIEAIANNIAILSKGNLITYSNTDILLDSMKGKVWDTFVSNDDLNEFKNKYIISRITHRNDGVNIRILNDIKPSNTSNLIAPNLEDSYIYYLNKNSK